MKKIQTEITVDTVRQVLSQRTPLMIKSAPQHRDAAVAVILRDSLTSSTLSPELLLIQRAQYPQDPWSGNLSFPGGKIDPDDRSVYAAAIRETREEVNLCLRREHCLGRLDDIYAVSVKVRVSAYVFNVPAHFDYVQGNCEVERHFWVPMTHFLCGDSHAMRTIAWHEDRAEVPSFLIHPEAPPLWGLTYRFVRQLLRHCGFNLSLARD
ncbi:MAG: CoA pyrophosphatase [Desulfuromonadaceae bacterium]|nr:CoA pyrophosphatase [Desulfuromonas sp.]MDY0185097.1 CoA pyrophosphatase [Desulfuromonadaceae bacterium]